MEWRIGQGYDVHAIAEGLTMHLGGVVVSDQVGFVAHSDGDVAIHALCDALLGALALGDIGKHFPDNSDRWKGIDSRILLRQVVGMLAERGWKPGNVDITIALQAPKIGSFVPAMREVLAADMGIDPDKVSVKATTTERLGFVGRGEGCEVWAIALVVKE
ncbi:MAG: 2-C-methyl-D-erythritol 2,4-cyclodiphosphate synthase [Bacteroidales bacterium]|nr:2-C-methyl-D-erythritol 2,4-cyclodiphosphate synthase [Bacteroidales bacterium]MDD6751810.1 2-C-methyl-D-erythritol 2,4-cyclodiphosphate synthase [Bacteroidales bacterium]